MKAYVIRPSYRVSSFEVENLKLGPDSSIFRNRRDVTGGEINVLLCLLASL